MPPCLVPPLPARPGHLHRPHHFAAGEARTEEEWSGFQIGEVRVRRGFKRLTIVIQV